MNKSKPISVVIVSIHNLVAGLALTSIGLLGILLFPVLSSKQAELIESYGCFLFGVVLLSSAWGLWTQQVWSQKLAIAALIFPLIAFLTVAPEALTSAVNASGSSQALALEAAVGVFLIIIIWSKQVDQWLKG